jgi:hypothetical protein
MGVRSVGNGWGRQARDLPPMDFLKNSPNWRMVLYQLLIR